MRACPNNITELLPHGGEERRGEEKCGHKGRRQQIAKDRGEESSRIKKRGEMENVDRRKQKER